MHPYGAIAKKKVFGKKTNVPKIYGFSQKNF
jgi:hypothetical protein